MEIKILKVSTDELIGATILDGKSIKLPSMQDGWRFNFEKLSKTIQNAETYVLITNESPQTIEGCVIVQLIDKKIPYMAYLEVAPHNQTNPKRYDYIAGCLIAFAFKLSVQKGKGDYQAQLFFDVQEDNEDISKKLIYVYRSKYGALLMGETTLVIMDEAGYKLIKKYLERQFKD